MFRSDLLRRPHDRAFSVIEPRSSGSDVTSTQSGSRQIALGQPEVEQLSAGLVNLMSTNFKFRELNQRLGARPAICNLLIPFLLELKMQFACVTPNWNFYLEFGYLLFYSHSFLTHLRLLLSPHFEAFLCLISQHP